MALVFADRVWMTTATTGTGTITLGSAVGGYATFADASIADGSTVHYVILDGSDYERGTGTYTAAGTTLSRTVISSRISGVMGTSLKSLSGSATVFVSAFAADLAFLPITNVFAADQTFQTATGVVLRLKTTKVPGAAADLAGSVNFLANDAGSTSFLVGQLVGNVSDATAGNPTGQFYISTTVANVLQIRLAIRNGIYTTSIASDPGADSFAALHYFRNIYEVTPYEISLTATYTLTSQTAAQKLFNSSTNGAFNASSNTTYEFECLFSLSSMSATSGSFGFALGGTAVITSQAWSAIANKVATLATATADQSSFNTAANTALTTENTNTSGWAQIKGRVRITTAGTLIPQVSLGVAAAAIVGVNSYFRIRAIDSNTVTTLGSWA